MISVMERKKDLGIKQDNNRMNYLGKTLGNRLNQFYKIYAFVNGRKMSCYVI